MKRSPGLLVVLSSFFFVAPLAARVVSYAPYTSRIALPSFQDRASRHFVLIEAKAEVFTTNGDRDVVMYDSTGAEEPRVITPSPGVWQQTALYEKSDGPPLILAVKAGQIMLSEGGTDWRPVTITGSIRPRGVRDVDTGGPFTHGLFSPIVLGNDEWPFVVSLVDNGVWAIRRTGQARLLVGDSEARLMGRNAAGDRFLIHTGPAIWMVTLDATLTKIADGVIPSRGYAGWITAGGTVYIEELSLSGRTVFVADGTPLTMNVIASAPPAAAGNDEEPVPLRVFAVPTHDYEGAWIIDRAPGQSTSLSRHKPSQGRVTMWTDESAPEVEALIAGASGESLLIQVHRTRESFQDEAALIIDPALAVWRVGDPAPHAYDELYLNEQWNKGFVVVDVERVASGDVFVFNSGFRQIERVPESRVSAPIGGGSDVFQEWGVVRASLKQRLVLPGVARLRGAYDSFWQTDVTLYNPLTDPQEVEIVFVPLGGESPVSTKRLLRPYQLRAMPDVLRTLFGIDSGGGSLHLIPEIGINATARTYTRKGAGTYGFGMHAIDFFNAVGARSSLTFSGAFPGRDFRTNVLLTDTSGRGAHAQFKMTEGWWSPPRNVGELATPVDGATQTTIAGPGHDNGAALVIEPTRGTAIATVVTIDNRSNDPTWLPPDLPGSVPRTIPVMGHVDGAYGAKYRSDLYLHNPRAGSRWVVLNAWPWHGGGPRQRWVRLDGNESRVIRDAVRELFGMTGMAWIRYGSPEDEPGEGVRVTSRTYTVDENGATYGCLVPPLNGFQIAGAGERLEILGAAAGPGFRTNVGLIDVSGTSIDDATVRVYGIGEPYRVLFAKTAKVPRNGGVQLNDIFEGPQPNVAMVIVEVVEGQQVAAYATLVDNTTNDSTYLGSQLGAKETN